MQRAERITIGVLIVGVILFVVNAVAEGLIQELTGSALNALIPLMKQPVTIQWWQLVFMTVTVGFVIVLLAFFVARYLTRVAP